MGDTTSVTFERLTDLGPESPTLIEGLPGNGLVASITVEQITEQLELTHHGNIISEEFPHVLSYRNGRARDHVRVYAGSDPSIMTLQSDVPLPASAFPALSECVHEQLAEEFDRAIFLVGARAESEEDVGTIEGIATTDALEADLRAANVDLAAGAGVVGGVTGALARDCYHYDVPAVVLIVHANPQLPDPTAARSVIENALEPIVDFDIETEVLEEEAAAIKAQLQQVADHQQQMSHQANEQSDEPPNPSMYQ